MSMGGGGGGVSDKVAASTPLNTLISGNLTEASQRFGGFVPFLDDLLGLSLLPIGPALAISGNTILVGAPQRDVDAINIDKGAAYVFSATGLATGATGNTPLYTLISGATGAQESSSQYFGSSVAISGNTILVGAPRRDVTGATGEDKGAAYVFDYTTLATGATGNLPLFTLISGNTTETSGQLFGSSVAISGSTILVGAPKRDATGATGENKGAAYVFDTATLVTGATGNTPLFTLISGNTTETLQLFGASVAISGSTILVGAPRRDATGAISESKGAAYVFSAIGIATGATGNTPLYTLISGNTTETSGQLFGSSVAISGNTILVGTPQRDVDGINTNKGAAYVFSATGLATGATGNTPLSTLISGNTTETQVFGSSVAISGNTILVGAPYRDATGTTTQDKGAAYVFSATGLATGATGNTPLSTLISGNTTETQYFGASVAISGNTILVGAPRRDVDGIDTNKGAAYVFTKFIVSDISANLKTAFLGDVIKFKLAITGFDPQTTDFNISDFQAVGGPTGAMSAHGKVIDLLTKKLNSVVTGATGVDEVDIYVQVLEVGTNGTLTLSLSSNEPFLGFPSGAPTVPIKNLSDIFLHFNYQA